MLLMEVKSGWFFCVWVCAFLAGEGSVVFIFFLDRLFFFGPKWILWCEKVGVACADKADTKRPDQLSFSPTLSSHLSLSTTLYRCPFSGSRAY
jgi:hypothetical protein